MNILDITRACFERHGFLQSPGVVAVSGGGDSVALAHVLTRCLQSRAIPGLALVHLNHQLRGADSDGDEAFVAALPQLWQAPALAVYTRRLDVAALARAGKANLEDTARRARYDYFAETAQLQRAAWVATAHTADDQAETVLLRLLRGSGLRGLAAMPEVRPLASNVILVRPWLTVRRQAVRDYLAQNHLALREDASNEEMRFTRNRLRHDLLPRLQGEYNPGVVEVLTRLAAQARQANDLVERLGEDCRSRAERPRAGSLRIFALAELATAHDLIVQEMFRRVWAEESWPMAEMGYEEWRGLLAVVRGLNRARDFPGGIRAERTEHVVRVGLSG